MSVYELARLLLTFETKVLHCIAQHLSKAFRDVREKSRNNICPCVCVLHETERERVTVRVAPNVGGCVREVQVRPSVYRDFRCITVRSERAEIKTKMEVR
jgi:hypothetical protein